MKTLGNIKKELITLTAFLLIGLFLDLKGIIGYDKDFLELFPSWQFDLLFGLLIYNVWTIFRLVFNIFFLKIRFKIGP